MEKQLGSPQVSNLPTSIEETLNARNKERLTEILTQTCALQKQYGKTVEELEILVEGFAWALADFKMPEIIAAFRRYIRENSDIPAPADIIKLIEGARRLKTRLAEPSPEPKLSPTIDDLRRYDQKGIPLTPEQRQRLKDNAA